MSIGDYPNKLLRERDAYLSLLVAAEHSYAGAWLGFERGTAIFANLDEAVAAVQVVAGLREGSLPVADGPSYMELAESREAALAARDGAIIACAATEAERDAALADRNQAVAERDEALLRLTNQPMPMPTDLPLGVGFQVGDYVRRRGSDWKMRGVIVAIFNKRRGAVRFVVEDAVGGCFVESLRTIEADPDARGAADDDTFEDTLP